MVSINDIQVIRAASAYCMDGNKVGRIGDVYVDDLTSEPAWVTITAGLFGTKTAFAPLAGATLDGDRLVLGYSSSVIAGAPAIADSGHISDSEQRALIDYFTAHQPGVAAPVVDAVVPEPVVEVPVVEVPVVEVPVVEVPVVEVPVVEVPAPDAPVFDLAAHLRDGLDRAAGTLTGAGAAEVALSGLAPEAPADVVDAVASVLEAPVPEPEASWVTDEPPVAETPVAPEPEPEPAPEPEPEPEPVAVEAFEPPAPAEVVAPIAPAEVVAAAWVVPAASSWWDDQPVSVDGPDVELTASEAAEASGAEDWASEGGSAEASPAEAAPEEASAVDEFHLPVEGAAVAPAEGDRTPQDALSGQFRMHPGHTRETIYRDAAGNILYSVIDSYEAIFGNQG